MSPSLSILPRLPAFALAAVLCYAGGAPDGDALVPVTADRLQQVIREAGSRVVMVNVWATWCVPCREEFPDLVRLRRAYPEEELSVLFVSADFDPEQDGTREFLREQGVDFVSYLKDEDDMAFIESLSDEWSGALPATFVYDSEGTLVEFWQGKASYDKLDRAVRSVNGRENR